jgi:hypothetical protein
MRRKKCFQEKLLIIIFRSLALIREKNSWKIISIFDLIVSPKLSFYWKLFSITILVLVFTVKFVSTDRNCFQKSFGNSNICDFICNQNISIKR